MRRADQETVSSRFDLALFRLWLRLYPAEFRRRHQEELEAAYAHCLFVERTRRGPALARLIGLVDAIRAAVSLRRPRTAPPPRRPRGALVQDVRFAVRGFRRAPLFFGGMLLVLALGIGANGAIFSLGKAVLLDPLPYRDPDRLVMLLEVRGTPARAVGTGSTAIKNWRAQMADALEGLAAIRSWDGNITAQFDYLVEDRMERLRAAFVTPDFFHVLGVDASIGRTFDPADEPGDTALVVLSHELWERAFGADPAVIGRTVPFVSGRGRTRAATPYTIVGVLPPAFAFTYPAGTELWAMLPWAEVMGDPGLAVSYDGAVARLRDGVAFEAASARFSTISISRRDTGGPPNVAFQPVTDWVSGASRPAILLLAAVGALLLLMTCVTVASGLLVRLADRQRELAMRAALGAGRGRLVRQLVSEGLVLSMAGTGLGVGLAGVLMPVLRSLVPATVPRAADMDVDAGLVLFAAAVTTIATVLVSMAPALQARRLDVVTALKRGGTSSPTARVRRWRSGLVGVQAAVAASLLITAALLLASFRHLNAVDLGFETEHVMTVEMRIVDSRAADPDYLDRFQQSVLERVRVLPGVQSAALATAVPFRGVDFMRTFDAPGCEAAPGQQAVRPECRDRAVGARNRVVGPSFFETMGIPLLKGRLLADTDTANTPKVGVVSESFARRMFGDDDPIGQRIGGYGATEVVGVVGDVRYEAHHLPPEPAVYVSTAQEPTELMCLLVRVAPGVPGVGAAIRGVVHDVDPTVPAMHLATVSGIVGDSIADRRFYTTTAAAFASLALLLAATGLIVVIGRTIIERRREMAIRTTLGARRRDLVMMVTGQGLQPALGGLTVGLLAAAAAAVLLRPFLFGVSPHDPLAFGGVGLLIGAVAVLACLAPARRLSQLAPAALLRSE